MGAARLRSGLLPASVLPSLPFDPTPYRPVVDAITPVEELPSLDYRGAYRIELTTGLALTIVFAITFHLLTGARPMIALGLSISFATLFFLQPRPSGRRLIAWFLLCFAICI